MSLSNRHEHKWNPKTLVCVSCGTTYREAWNEWAKKAGTGRQVELPPITQLERGVKA